MVNTNHKLTLYLDVVYISRIPYYVYAEIPKLEKLKNPKHFWPNKDIQPLDKKK